MKRVFYVLYLPNRELQIHLDLMRLVCDSSVTSPAHLTVRGPYPTEQNTDSIWKHQGNIKVHVGGVGAFFSERQNTVFLKCISHDLKRFWYKPDFGGFEPHITIYDGGSRMFAEQLSGLLKEYDLSFGFSAERLLEHESANGQFSLALDWNEYAHLLTEIGEAQLNKRAARDLEEMQRLQIVGKIAEHFETVLRSEQFSDRITSSNVAVKSEAPTQSNAMLRDKIFISHANPEDNEFARWLTLRLITEGYPVWCDLVKLRGGEDFWRDIEDTIRRRTAKFIYVLSKSSNTKEGPLQELAVAKAIAREHTSLSDFVIPVHIDDLPYSKMNIEIKRLTAIPFDSGWAKGLELLLQKFEDEHISKDSTYSANVAASWWREQFSANAGVVSQQEEYLSSWFPIEALPREIYFHILQGQRVSAKQTDAAVEPAYPVVSFGSGVFSFAKRDDFQETLIRGLLIPDSHCFLTQDLLDGKHAEFFVDARQARNAIIHLLAEAWRRTIISRGLAVHSMANRSWCFYFVKDQVENDRLDYTGMRGESARRYVMGYRTIRTRDEMTKLRHWHFGLSAKPFLYPSFGFAVRGHVLFSDDGKQVWASADRLQRARMSQCKNWWNDDWRDRMLATMTWLARDYDYITVPVGRDVFIKVSKSPIKFLSNVAYIEPSESSLSLNRSRHDSLPDEDEDEDEDWEDSTQAVSVR